VIAGLSRMLEQMKSLMAVGPTNDVHPVILVRHSAPWRWWRNNLRETPRGLMIDFIIQRPSRFIFVTKFCYAFKSMCAYGFRNVRFIMRSGRCVWRRCRAHRQTIRSFRRNRIVVVIRIRLVEQTNQVGILFNRT